MDGSPARYTRLLVFLGLLPLLLMDMFLGLPDGVFPIGGAVIMTAAALVHFYGGERRAGVGWILFGAALLFVSSVEIAASLLYLVVFAMLLLSGLVLLASQRAELGDEA